MKDPGLNAVATSSSQPGRKKDGRRPLIVKQPRQQEDQSLMRAPCIGAPRNPDPWPNLTWL
jgi:hypothetical protein